MYKFIADIFFEKLNELEPITSVEIGVILIRTLQNYALRKALRK